MKKTILTIFASALLAGSMMQAATAGEHHRHIARHYRAAPVVLSPSSRDAYASYGVSASDLAERGEAGILMNPSPY
jgi:Ni/Co efflux regulator RcnB